MQRNPTIECDESAVVPNRQSEQIRVGNLPRTVDPCCIELCGVEETYLINPKLVDALCASLTQAPDNRLNRLRIRI